MLFQVYGDTAVYQWIGWVVVFLALIGFNEIARRTKAGGITCFLVIPAILTAYFIAIYAGAAAGADWALNNPTYLYMNSWFHYAKVYAATAGCIGFMMLEVQLGQDRQRSHWFKCVPVRDRGHQHPDRGRVSDFESAITRMGLAAWVSERGRRPLRRLA